MPTARDWSTKLDATIEKLSSVKLPAVVTAQLEVAADAVALLAAGELSEEEVVALFMIVSFKPFARGERMREAGVGEYQMSNPLIQSLIQKGYLRANKAGAMQADVPKAKALFKTMTPPVKYKDFLLNAYMFFKYPEKNDSAA